MTRVFATIGMLTCALVIGFAAVYGALEFGIVQRHWPELLRAADAAPPDGPTLDAGVESEASDGG